MAQIVKNLPKIQFNPWIQKIPWRRKWQPDPVFLLGKFPGQRSLVGYSLWGVEASDMTKLGHTHTHTYRHTYIGVQSLSNV